jgi:hypothetical protein
MDKILFLQFSNSATGLCNQIYSLVSGICVCIRDKKNIIVVGNFSKNINTQNYCPISEIIDINKLNIFLKKNNITLVDNNFIELKNINVKYGVSYNNKDVTDKVLLNSKKIIICKDIDFNLICTDFLPNIKKKIFINFELNNVIHEFVYDEYIGHPLSDIIIDFENITYQDIKDWNILNTVPYNVFFKKILKELKFSPHLENIINSTITKLVNNHNPHINIIHLRLEDDGIKHWSAINNMDFNTFKNILREKYIKEIKKNIDKKTLTFILTSNCDNIIHDYLKLNNYNFNITEKLYKDREVNAIIDLSVGKLCNNIYIGPGCSTFTQCIVKMINNKKTILFDLDHIHAKTIIQYN